MRNLKRRLLNKPILLIWLAAVAHADRMDGPPGTVLKDVIGAPGNSVSASADFTLSFAWGQPVSGGESQASPYTLVSGYLAGGFGNGQPFVVLTSQVGNPETTLFTQNNVPIGQSIATAIKITLTDALDADSVIESIQATALKDNMGRTVNRPTAVQIETDAANGLITITPQKSWSGNTLFDVALSQKLRSVDGTALDQTYHLYFQTMLDPREENVSQEGALPVNGQATGAISNPEISLYLPPHSLKDFATVLFNPNPNIPAGPANDPYRMPVSIREITAYDSKGEVIRSLSAPATITVAPPSHPLVRAETYALWVYDEKHHLWVKIPASQVVPNSGMVRASVAQLSTFALMGGPDGSARDAFAFPVPWRPFGPQAGPGPGQTGTEAGGITFSNLPSESTIKIYTIAGDLVRTLAHSDVTGPMAQEPWDVKTSGGEPVASGVYLWQVESPVDKKTGKILVIR